MKLILNEDLILEFVSEVSPFNYHLDIDFVNITLRQYLEKHPVVTSRNPHAGLFDVIQQSEATHKARLLGPVLIQKDTAEDILKDIRKFLSKYEDITTVENDFLKRIDLLLDKGE